MAGNAAANSEHTTAKLRTTGFIVAYTSLRDLGFTAFNSTKMLLKRGGSL